MHHSNVPSPAVGQSDEAREFDQLCWQINSPDNTDPNRNQQLARLPAARSDPRLRELARRIYRLGERPLFELFAELQAGAGLRDSLERYAALSGDFIKALGGDKLPPSVRALVSP
jgi:hypothetical protein